VTHVCRTCRESYDCPFCPDQGWACSTLNDDEDANLCDWCMTWQAIEYQAYWDSQPA
jgi:hypothetical protein